MAYDYDHSKTAVAKLDLWDEWRDIVKKHDTETQQELEGLLRRLVPHLRSAGFDLDLTKSYLDKRYKGSDGVRIVGELTVIDREENSVYSPNKESVKKWVEMATGMDGSVKKIGELPGREGRTDKRGIWQVDISAD